MECISNKEVAILINMVNDMELRDREREFLGGGCFFF
jgi:hypothetical protein